MAGKRATQALVRISGYVDIDARGNVMGAATWQVPAHAVTGNLALHADVSGNGYAITHVPTGCAIFRGIESLEIARDLLRELTQLDWQFDDPCEVPPPTQAAMREITHWHNGGPMTHAMYEVWCRVWVKP